MPNLTALDGGSISIGDDAVAALRGKLVDREGSLEVALGEEELPAAVRRNRVPSFLLF